MQDLEPSGLAWIGLAVSRHLERHIRFIVKSFKKSSFSSCSKRHAVLDIHRGPQRHQLMKGGRQPPQTHPAFGNVLPAEFAMKSTPEKQVA